MTIALKQFLFERLGGCADKRRKNLNGECLFNVDESLEHDCSPDICGIHALVTDAPEFQLRFQKLPMSPAVAELLASKEAGIEGDGMQATATVNLTTKDVPFIRKLAKAIRRIVGRGRRYSIRNWKWACPRAGESLERFANLLAEFRKGCG